jgi:hypothetical protein
MGARHVRRALGLAAFVAAARAAWLHHLDNQAVIRTDLMRDAFAAGQAAERNRAAEDAELKRRAGAYWSSPNSYGGPVGDIASVIEPLDPEVPGWIEWGDGHGGTSR